MPRKTYKLTVRSVKELVSTRRDGERFYDSKLPAFGVRVWPSQSGDPSDARRAYFLDYTSPLTHKRRRITLGKTTEMPPDKARTIARDMQAAIRAGTDPLEERNRQRTGDSLPAWVERYLAIGDAEGRWSKAWRGPLEAYLGRATDTIGAKPLSAVTAEDVERFRDEQAKRGTATANRALAALKGCLTEAWRRDIIPGNPGAKVRNLRDNGPRQRVLSDDELAALEREIDGLKDPCFRTALRWLIATGARVSEVRRARWANLDLSDPEAATWRVPKPKNRKPIVKPLPTDLATEIAALPRDGEHVVGAWSEGQGHYTRFHRNWLKVRDAAGLPSDIRIHDIRRTFGLHATRTGGLHLASKLLGHSSVTITAAVYSPLQDSDLREAQRAVSEARKAAAKKNEEDKPTGD